MKNNLKSKIPGRIGFHYYPDSLHYRDSDLQAWLSTLQTLGAAWLTLEAPTNRTIPESFLTGLLSKGIEPILWFRPPLTPIHPPAQASDEIDWQLLLETYARWGVRYTLFFDRPNLRTSWSPRAWVQSEPVESFLDFYLPVAEIAVQAGLAPIFPPLEPGGDYWDTAFLRDCLQAMLRRSSKSILNALIIAAHAHYNPGKLSWGMGGPERWPEARPYTPVSEQQDQRGFYIFEWYQAIVQAALGQPRPMILFEVGRASSSEHDASFTAQQTQAEDCLSVAHLLAGKAPHGQPEAVELPPLNPVPSEILAANFWLLADTQDGAYIEHAWFKPDGEQLPSVQALSAWQAQRRTVQPSEETTQQQQEKSIAHYLLLPQDAAGDFLADIRTFVAQHHPTIGFSLQEASKAARVSVFGGAQAYQEAALEELIRAGCQVVRILPVGMDFATNRSESTVESITLDTN